MKPLPANLPPLPEGCVYLGLGETFKTAGRFLGFDLEPGSKKWTWSSLHQGLCTTDHYAAPDDSEVVRLNAQPTTVLGWLETMPEPWRGQAIANIQDQAREQKADSICQALVNAFDWDDAPERESYWDQVCFHFKRGRDLPSPETAANYVAPVERQLVSLEKKYRTESGWEVVLYTVTGMNPESPVVGSIFDPGVEEWLPLAWAADGEFVSDESEDSHLRLVEVRPEPRELKLYRYGGGWTTNYASHTDECIRVREVTD